MVSPSGRLKPSPLAKLFFAIAWNEARTHRKVERALTNEFGPLIERSETYCFSQFSKYYDEELGDPVWKYLVSPERLQPADRIVEVKHLTERLERQHSFGEGEVRNRTVNIDPGYLNSWQVVLSTVKNHAHRISMGRGVFCEVTLLFQAGAFHRLPWTSADYASSPVMEFLSLAREGYKNQLALLESKERSGS